MSDLVELITNLRRWVDNESGEEEWGPYERNLARLSRGEIQLLLDKIEQYRNLLEHVIHHGWDPAECETCNDHNVERFLKAIFEKQD